MLAHLSRFPLYALLLLAANSASAAAALTADKAKIDAGILVQAMNTLHPALDKYRTPAEVKASMERFQARAAAARNAGEMYLAATELAAAVRCGHTWTNVLNQQGPARRQILESADKLPLIFTLVEGRWLVLGSAHPGIVAGDEIVTIDGRNAAQVVSMMMPYLRADGSSDGKRLRQLGHDRSDYSMMDIVWPLLSPPAGGSYKLELRNSQGATRKAVAKAVTLEARDAALASQVVPGRSENWTFRIDGDRAVMTLPTFSVQRSKFNWQKFFAESFDELKRKQVKHLVIDIRDNEGGDGALALDLLSYLVKAPATYVADQSVTTYEKVPEKLSGYLDTWDTGFYDRSGNVDKIAEGPQAGRFRFRPKANKVSDITPRNARFTGKTWLLVGPENSSATFALAKLAKELGVATLVGQVTGGNQRGLNGGQLAWVNLPNSGVAVDIPLLAQSYTASTPDAGIAPDILVERHFAARMAGQDQEMDAVAHAIGQ
ncbi:MAG TPA: S41 family peptidase [Telluria sp.]|jgi:C-terminal processing protease CtpA/Prc